MFEVFGPVKKPYYSVTSANVERLKKEGKEGSLDKGTPVFFVPGASSFVHPTTIYTRGSDASGEHDEEPPEDVRHSRCFAGFLVAEVDPPGARVFR